jgi:hypothetical protein
MQNLDLALQAVVSVGAVGGAFLRMTLGQHRIEHTIREGMLQSSFFRHIR